MAAIDPKKVLLVEGRTEKRLIPELMEKRGVNWEPSPQRYAVTIREAGGPVTEPGFIETHLKESNLVALGILFDADEMEGNHEQRWSQVRDRCKSMSIDLPDVPPPEGYVTVLANSIRFGVWMMPDNKPPGMLETFLLGLLRPEEQSGALFQHAEDSVSRAKELGATFKSVHKDKALIHTWLSWQDEPGTQLHQAIKFRILDLAPVLRTSGCATKKAQPKWQRHKANTAGDLTRSSSARSPRWPASPARSRNRWPAIWA